MYNVRCVLPANCIFCDETKISLSFTKAIKIKRILRQNLYEFQYHAISPLYKYIYYWKSVSDIQFSSFYMARTHITFNKVQHSCKIFQISISNQHSCLSNYISPTLTYGLSYLLYTITILYAPQYDYVAHYYKTFVLLFTRKISTTQETINYSREPRRILTCCPL